MPRRLCLLLVLLAASCSRAAPPTALPGAGSSTLTVKLADLVNIVNVRDNTTVSFVAAANGETVPGKGEVRTGVSSRVRLDFSDGGTARLAENSLIVVDQLGGPDGQSPTRLKFSSGKLSVSLTGGQFEVQTPMGVARVGGSYAEFQYSPGPDPNTTRDDVLDIKCIEGICAFDNDTQMIVLTNLQQLVISNAGQSAAGPTNLPASAVHDFVANSPESTAVVLTLAAAAQNPTLPIPSGSPVPSLTSGGPAATRTNTPAPTATLQPSSTPTRTRRPPTAAPSDTSEVPTAAPSDTPSPTATGTSQEPPPIPPAVTDTQVASPTTGPTNTPVPPLTMTPSPTPLIPPAVTDTQVPPPTNTSVPPPTRTRGPHPTRTPKPTHDHAVTGASPALLLS
jgi:hypothetical protein